MILILKSSLNLSLHHYTEYIIFNQSLQINYKNNPIGQIPNMRITYMAHSPLKVYI